MVFAAAMCAVVIWAGTPIATKLAVGELNALAVGLFRTLLGALIAVPLEQRTPAVQRAIGVGAEFLLSRDPAVADYPYTKHVSSTWLKFGFPLTYWSDVLETIAVLAELGYGNDPRLANALRFILSKQDAQGRWKLENALSGKMWADIEKKGKPSKWVTLRALRVLKHAVGVLSPDTVIPVGKPPISDEEMRI